MNRTSIEWTDYSWPVVNGCRRKSAGCGTGRAGGCYAERLAATRLKHTDRYRGLAVMTDKGPQWTGEVRLVEAELEMPLRLRKPSRIFVADMGDLFYEAVPIRSIARVFAVMALAERHTFQLLTKRPERMRELLANERFWVEVVHLAEQLVLTRDRVTWGGMCGFDALAEQLVAARALRHAWLGVSVEDQATADERIPLLLDTPAAVRWVSQEPQIGEVVYREDWLRGRFDHCPEETDDPETDGCRGCAGWGIECAAVRGARLDWIVIGGESGPGARPFDLAWARSTIAQCRAAGVPVFCKQLGAHVVFDGFQPAGAWWPVHDAWAQTAQGFRVTLRDRKGGDPSEWPEDLRVREFPR